ncbi:MAG: MerR family transcriptional regulator, partial [Candidatus Gastranaerophilales bacterium]|nr:MerR family transcriptional regulator [Candidatus Gastranaerophilales bacterium]
MNTEGARTQGVEKTFSPDEVKRILNSDNHEIQRLCREVCISPKKDNLTGKTFFLRNDVEILRKIKELHNKGQQVMERQQSISSTAMITPRH